MRERERGVEGREEREEKKFRKDLRYVITIIDYHVLFRKEKKIRA